MVIYCVNNSIELYQCHTVMQNVVQCLIRMMGACYLLIFVKVREEIYTSTEEMSLLNSHVSTLELTNAYRCQLCAGKQVRVRKTLNKYSQMRCNCLYVGCSLKIPKCGLDVMGNELLVQT
ncbi:hypothetical protein T05_2183 [Trichinella murrelli]|uniref:Uncharacterized protein n=1 Tax=Trichinella murrelli TaxID=144512 RepID=A0A0V0TZM3_9BILA|nr:hypothetical protein T05_2183 [Trichinella murrelli]